MGYLAYKKKLIENVQLAIFIFCRSITPQVLRLMQQLIVKSKVHSSGTHLT